MEIDNSSKVESSDSTNEVVLENNKSRKKKHGFLYYFLNALLWTVIGGIVIYSALNIIDKKTGYSFLPNHTAVIVSGSMATADKDNTYLDENDKRIQINDVVISSPYKSFEDIKYKDVIFYLGEDGVLVCHRVIDKYESEGKQWVVCQGDANKVADTPVNYTRVKGKVTSVIPGIGWLIMFMQSPYFIMALGFSGFFIILGYFIATYKKEKKCITNNTDVIDNKVIEEKGESNEEDK